MSVDSVSQMAMLLSSPHGSEQSKTISASPSCQQYPSISCQNTQKQYQKQKNNPSNHPDLQNNQNQKLQEGNQQYPPQYPPCPPLPPLQQNQNYRDPNRKNCQNQQNFNPNSNISNQVYQIGNPKEGMRPQNNDYSNRRYDNQQNQLQQRSLSQHNYLTESMANNNTEIYDQKKENCYSKQTNPYKGPEGYFKKIQNHDQSSYSKPEMKKFYSDENSMNNSSNRPPYQKYQNNYYQKEGGFNQYPQNNYANDKMNHSNYQKSGYDQYSNFSQQRRFNHQRTDYHQDMSSYQEQYPKLRRSSVGEQPKGYRGSIEEQIRKAVEHSIQEKFDKLREEMRGLFENLSIGEPKKGQSKTSLEEKQFIQNDNFPQLHAEAVELKNADRQRTRSPKKIRQSHTDQMKQEQLNSSLVLNKSFIQNAGSPQMSKKK